LKILPPLFGLAVFALAGWVLYRELRTYHLKDIVQEMRALPAVRLALAALFAALSYLAATGYEHARHPLRTFTLWPTGAAPWPPSSPRPSATTSVSGCSQGGSIRLRLYSAWGLSVLEISQLVAFYTLSLWLGFLALGGRGLRAGTPWRCRRAAPALPVGAAARGRLPGRRGRVPGAHPDRAPALQVRSVQLSLPKPGFVPLQVARGAPGLVAGFRGRCTRSCRPRPGTVLPGLRGGVRAGADRRWEARVPGGLGCSRLIFDAAALPTGLAGFAILARLLAYRGIYYLLRWCGRVLLAVQELRRKRAAPAHGEPGGRALGSVIVRRCWG